jgi:disease resistance protein RPS2
MVAAVAAAGVGAGVGAVAGEVYKDGRRVASYIWDKVHRGKDLEDNHKRLKGEADKLSARRKDMENAANRDMTKELTNEDKCWIDRVKKSEEEVQELENVYEKKYKNRKWRLSDSIFRLDRAKLSKQMEKKCTELRGLLSEENLPLVEKMPERVITRHAPKIEDKSSLRLAFKEILGHLADTDVRKVGLTGIVGVGKTAIMQNLNNNEDIAKRFDIVIWLNVSKGWSIEGLQRAITQRLKLKVEDFAKPDETAEKILEELKNKNYLILLDDVSQVFDLRKIGISCDPNDGKVVLATRDRRICNDMHADVEVEVQLLSENDAYKMFLEKLGRNVNLTGNIEPIARLVARECACLPLVIEKIATTCRVYEENFESWENGLDRLPRFSEHKFQGMDELINFLEFCYNELGDEDKKFCFLYGALYPEDCEICIDHLLECWKAEDFIRNANEFRKARKKGWNILDELIRLSLLERSEKMNHVRMNKVVWRMAHKISEENNDFKILVQPGKELQEAPIEVKWQQANRISLMDTKLCTLPEKPCCKSLLTLFLQRNFSLEVIPESFFELMQNVRVLDLHDTRITSIPSSISSLTCLKALYLNSCICLMTLPTNIEKLKCLEILDIRDTGINFLPIQIQGLIGLKCLRLSLSGVGMGQSSDAEFGKDVLSRLSLLEELRINVDKGFLQLKTVMMAIAREVTSLKKLTSLSICFPGVDDLQAFISNFHIWELLHFKFQFSVGSHEQTRYKIFDNSKKYQIRRCLKLANGEGIDPAILAVLAQSDAFELTGHKGASKLSDFGVDNMKMLRGCLIEGCREIKTLVDGTSITSSALIGLEVMHINDAANLTSIWEGVFHSGSLARLKTLTLCRCSSLKKIFSNKDMIEQLSGLQNLKVQKCSEIEVIIMKFENSGLEPDVLPNLKTLVLLDLPKVTSIWMNDSIKWSSLKKIEISMCPLLKKLPFSNENAINLECIEVQKSWWDALTWQEAAIKERLQPICRFK